MIQKFLSKCLSEYGMLVMLLLLCVYYSLATIKRNGTEGSEGGMECATQVLSQSHRSGNVVIVAGTTPKGVEFADSATRQLLSGGSISARTISGDPRSVRIALQEMIASHNPPDAIICVSDASFSLQEMLKSIPATSSVPVFIPRSHAWPTFLTPGNLMNVTNQIVVTAVIAVGMTMVIITGGIDLSVGSLIALSAVITALLIRDHAGGFNAHAGGMIVCCAIAVLACGMVGGFSGAMITMFRVPPFIVTLAMMQVASGLAYIVAHGNTIHDSPDSFKWLGTGIGFLSLPNAIWLMLIVFVAAHVMMSRTRIGRYIYAVGGNIEAARLSGVGTSRVLMFVYILSGLSAGLGGVILGSQLKSGSPTYGTSYELYVIAAVVVGGTSLAGGEGNVIGTLIGALIIAVIRNGMNLTGVDDYHQKVVLGLLILGAVLLDKLKRRSWRMPGRGRAVDDQTAAKIASNPASSVAERQLQGLLTGPNSHETRI